MSIRVRLPSHAPAPSTYSEGFADPCALGSWDHVYPLLGHAHLGPRRPARLLAPPAWEARLGQPEVRQSVRSLFVASLFPRWTALKCLRRRDAQHGGEPRAELPRACNPLFAAGSCSHRSLQYWAVGSLGDGTSELTRYAGLLRGVESFGQCCAFGINSSFVIPSSARYSLTFLSQQIQPTVHRRHQRRLLEYLATASVHLAEQDWERGAGVGGE